MPLDRMPAMMLVPTVIYGSLRNAGDGSVYVYWCPTLKMAKADQANMSEGWGEECIVTVQTYEGSGIWLTALDNFAEEERERLEGAA
ncbi:MAG TPA: hypothetical protein VIY48_10560 [Candidatus Paceibacterota bacterium]